MGIPAFYRWLVEQYPRAIVEAEPPRHGKKSKFDNLYLDMNGIIHPCFHPQGLPAPKTYEEVFQAVFKYVDRIFSIVKPRKLLYLAIDGVAPRAKMNQQRSRRFRAAKDAADMASVEESGKLDSNVITPGTEFMALLSSALRYYIHLRMNGDPRWRGIKVILSDSSVPGEGEHKIMSYIRLQRNLPGFDPNTRHCLYGLDADLIMLGLATHEIHFSILREDVLNALKDKSLKSERDSSPSKAVSENLENYILKLRFQFVQIWILREYLAYAMKIPDTTVDGDLERLVDDFVFMCLFVGNDFLPHMPSLEISEGAIDLLMTVYKKEFVRMGGYLTNSFEVNLERVKHFLEALGSHEGSILRKRMQIQREWVIRNRRSSNNNIGRKRSKGQHSKNSNALEIQASNNSASIAIITETDKIKFGEGDWKHRYYAEKFEAETEGDREKIRKDVVLKYTEGICWVMHYYYGGVCSWQWFYPYHYAPFPSDFIDIDELKIQFTLGEPFKPFDQLMAVLPAASAHALPLFYGKLMTEASSPLLPFYPTDFELDMNGKRFSWQAICKLPFIEESCLLSEIARVEHTLTDEERQRNTLGMDVLFVHISHPLAMEIVSFYRSIDQPKLTKGKVRWKINADLSGGMNGYIFISDKPVQPLQIDSPINGMEIIANNNVLSVFYKCPTFHVHIPRPPEGVNFPGKSIGKKDIKRTSLMWHERSVVVGRLHSLRPIHKSLSGPRLAKVARQLVSQWYFEKRQASKGSMECGGGASMGGTVLDENLKTVCLADAGGNGESINVKTRKRKRKPKQNSSGELRDTCVGENGLASVSNTVEAVSVGDAEGDKSCGENLDTVCLGDASSNGKSSNGKTGKRKRKRKRKKNSTGELCDAHVGANGLASISNVVEAVSVGDTGGDKSCSDNLNTVCLVDAGGSGKSSNGKTRKCKQKRKQNSLVELYDNGLASISTTVEAVSVGDADGNKTCSNGADEKCTNGDSGSRLFKFHLSTDEAAPYSNLGEIISVGGDDKNCSDCGEDKSVVASGPELMYVGETKTSAGDTEDDKSWTSNCLPVEKAVGVPDNNQGGELERSTCQLKVDQTAGDKSSTDDGSEKHKKKKRKRNKGNCIVPNDREAADGLSCDLNFEKRTCADEAQGEKQDKGNNFPSEHASMGQLDCSSRMEEEAICCGGPEGDRNYINGIFLELRQEPGRVDVNP